MFNRIMSMLNSQFGQKINDLFFKIADFFTEYGAIILKCLLVFFIGMLAIRIIAYIFKKIFSKTKIEHIVSKYIIMMIKILLYSILIISILKMFGVDTSSIVALFTTLSLALSLALENIFTNIANGLLIIVTKPFKEGDWIAVGDYEGIVAEIKLLYTVLNTFDNKSVNIPNSRFVAGEVTNYNANPTRKVVMLFDVAYNSDVDKVKQVIMDCITSNDNALLDPAPIVRLKSLNSSSISFQVVVNCKTSSYWALYYSLLDNVFNEFKRNDISIPFNQMEVRLLNDSQEKTYRDAPLPQRTNNGKMDQNYDEDLFEMIDRKMKEQKQKSVQKKNNKNKKEK